MDNVGAIARVSWINHLPFCWLGHFGRFLCFLLFKALNRRKQEAKEFSNHVRVPRHVQIARGDGGSCHGKRKTSKQWFPGVGFYPVRRWKSLSSCLDELCESPADSAPLCEILPQFNDSFRSALALHPSEPWSGMIEQQAAFRRF